MTTGLSGIPVHCRQRCPGGQNDCMESSADNRHWVFLSAALCLSPEERMPIKVLPFFVLEWE